MSKSTIDSKRAGIRNEELILSILRKNGQLSQSQLCKLAGLSSSTASYIIGRLRDKGLITETRGKSTSRGAKPVLISIDSAGAYAVGVEINPTSILLGLFDFNSNLIDTIKSPLDKNHLPQEVCDCLEINLRGLLSKYQIDENRLLGIGITLSGSISQDGVVRLSSPMGWHSVPLKKMLEERLAASINIYPTKVRLLAELAIKPELEFQNVLYLNIGNGVGGNVIIDGNLAQGATNQTCEIGHIMIDPQGPSCGCGHKGCLEALISGPAIAKKINSDIENGTATLLKNTIKPQDTPEMVLRKVALAIEKQDSYALQIRDFIADNLVRATTIAVNCFDPDLIILAGYVSQQCGEFFIDAIRDRAVAGAYGNETRDIQVRPAKAGEKALIIGSAMAIVQDSPGF